MPEPKISAVFNNCPLHALTPEIKEQVRQFATLNEYNNGHNAEYERLKTVFATFYDIAPLSWKQFSGILESYNPFDTQMVLGPVMRNFMKKTIAENELVQFTAGELGISTDEYISKLTSTSQTDPRYRSLSPHELSAYIGLQLGLNINYHETAAGDHPTLLAELPVATVNIFHTGGAEGAQAGGHWERTRNATDMIDHQNDDDTQLHDIIGLLGNEHALNLIGIDLLKTHVKYTKNSLVVKPYDAVAGASAELALTAAQILKYVENVNSVPKDMAKRLIPTSQYPLTAQAEAFIRDYHLIQDEVPANDYNARYVRADANTRRAMDLARAAELAPGSPDITKQLLDRLLQPVSMPVYAERRLRAYLAAMDRPPAPTTRSISLSRASSIVPAQTAPTNPSARRPEAATETTALLTEPDTHDDERPRTDSPLVSRRVDNPIPVDLPPASRTIPNDPIIPASPNVTPKPNAIENVNLQPTALDQAKSAFIYKLSLLNPKAHELENRGEREAALDVRNFRAALEAQYHIFFPEQTLAQPDIPGFKNICKQIFKEYRPKLETHRVIDVDLLFSIITVGIYALVAAINASVNHTRFGFFPTASAKLADDVEKSINEIQPNAGG